jgi:RNA polymerase sigma-70 factor (ECF subfamily)
MDPRAPQFKIAAAGPTHTVEALPSRLGASVDDSALAALAVERDPHALALLWDRYAPGVRALVRRTIAGRADVEDLVQDVFVALLRSIGDLKDPRALRGFVYRVASNVLCDELRRRRRRNWLTLFRSEAQRDEPVADQSIADPSVRIAMLRLQRVFDQLSDELRMAYVLRVIEGLELEEVAVALDCSLSTAKRRVAQAKDLVFASVRNDPTLSHFIQSRDQEVDHG